MFPFWAVVAVAYFGQRFSANLNLRIAPWIAITVLFLSFVESSITSERATLLAGNPLMMGSALCILVFCCTHELANQSAKRSILGGIGAICCLVTMVTLAQTRVPFVIAIVLMISQVLAQVFLTNQGKSAVRRQILFLCLAFGVSLAGAATQQRFTETSLMLLAEMKGTPNQSSTRHTMSERFILWSGAREAISEKPLFGYGLQNRATAALERTPQKTQSRYTHLHSMYFTNLVAGGIVGIGLFFASVLIPFFMTIRTLGIRHRKSILFVPVAISIGLNGLTNVILFESSSALLLGLSLVIFTSQKPDMQSQ